MESNNSVVAAKENTAVYFNNKVFGRFYKLVRNTILRDFTRWWRILTLQTTQD